MSSGSDKDSNVSHIGMRRKEQWEQIEHGLDVVGDLIDQIAGMLAKRNHDHPVERAVKLSNPDLATLFSAVTEFEEFHSYLKEDGHCDSVQQMVIDVHLARLEVLRNLCTAMVELNQEAVNELMEQLRWIQ